MLSHTADFYVSTMHETKQNQIEWKTEGNGEEHYKLDLEIPFQTRIWISVIKENLCFSFQV